MKKRNSLQVVIDFFTFPIRAFVLFEKDLFFLSSLQSERYYYVASEVVGKCLDVGCGKNNRFIVEFLNNQGVGIDVYKYEGLTDKDIVPDMTKLPYRDMSFDTITLIANINHIPKPIRQKELKELYRVLKNGGKVIVTMGNPLVEVLVHKVVELYDKYLGTRVDVDSERGMDHDEEYYLTREEIFSILTKSGFKYRKEKPFLSQWGLNRLYVFCK